VRYFTNAGPARGPLLYGTTPEAIGVLDAPGKLIPIGIAQCIGQDAAGLALWSLSVHGADMPGRWVVVDREFHPAESE
jgi:hypothetical protein